MKLVHIAGACLASLWLVAAQPLRADAPEIIRVGTSGDYAPFSLRMEASEERQGAREFEGFDPAIARAWAEARGFEVRFVRFRWPELLRDLAADRFDLAMSGITIRSERSVAGRFSVPVAESGAMLLLPVDSPVTSPADLDRAGARIAVNAGGHLEQVAHAHFPSAEVLAIAANEDVAGALGEGRADAVVTDSLEAPHWLAARPGLRAIGPFTRDRKAYLLGADERELARDLDLWLLANEANGKLAKLRADHLGQAGDRAPVAKPLPALLAAVDERLALMPWVAEAKRRGGEPVEIPDREVLVLEAAYRGVRQAEIRRRAIGDEGARPPLDPRAVRRFFTAQMNAAKDVQRAVLAAPAPADVEPVPDLAHALRPALIRIGQRIAFLLVALPLDLERERVSAATREALAGHSLSSARVDEIAAALYALASGPGDDAPPAPVPSAPPPLP